MFEVNVVNVVNGEVIADGVVGVDLGIDSSKVLGSKGVVDNNDNNVAFAVVVCTLGAKLKIGVVSGIVASLSTLFSCFVVSSFDAV